jgi:uncharacterized protein DUF2550
VGEGLALDAAWLLAAFLVILVLAAAGIATRRFLLERGGGTVECGLRRQNGSWRLGVARYRGEELRWYGIFGLSVRPDDVFLRRDLTVVSRRLPTEAEAASLGPGMIVVECRLGEDTGSHEGSDSAPGADDGAAPPRAAVTVELALGESALTGLLAWLEASPPGSHLGVSL